MNILPLYNAIYAQLTANTGVGSFYESVGGRVRLIQAAQDEATPLCVIEPTGNAPQRYFDGQGDDVELAFLTRLYADRQTATQPYLPGSLVTAQGRLIDTLDREVITATGWGNVQAWAVDLGSLTIENDAWLVVTTWKLIATPA